MAYLLVLVAMDAAAEYLRKFFQVIFCHEWTLLVSEILVGLGLLLCSSRS
jgi:hypothetical protein